MKKDSWWKKMTKTSLVIDGFLVFFYIFSAKFISFVKELFVASEIGVSPDLDAFVLALIILKFTVNFLFEPLAYAVVPPFVRLTKYGRKRANVLFNQLFFFGSCFLVLAGVILFFTAADLISLITSNYDETFQSRTTDILIRLMPFYFFTSVSAFLGAYLNAFQKNFLYAFYQAFPAIATIGLFLLAMFPNAIDNQIVGFNWGAGLGSFWMLWQCRQYGYRFEWSLRLSPHLRSAVKQWMPLAIATILTAINPLIDKVMATSFDLGAVSSLEYGSKLFTIFTSFAVGGVSIVYFPLFSKQVADRDYTGIKSLVIKSVSILFIPLTLVATFTFIFASEITAFLFERGAFLPEDTFVVSELMKFYVICLPILTIGIIGVRLLNALQMNYYVTLFSVINIVGNVIFNLLFMKWFGLPGLALSSSLVFSINAILIWGAAYYKSKIFRN